MTKPCVIFIQCPLITCANFYPAMPEKLLSQVAVQVSTIESKSVRQAVSAYVQLLAGLRFKKALIRQVFQEGMMRESVIYQEILQEGERKGKQEECLALVLRLLMRRLGSLESGVLSQVTNLPLSALEDLAEALIDFSTVTDLNEWLRLR
jgi:predicted transposase YdaD